MTRVDFHVNATDKLGYGCRLVRKIYHAGHKVVVHSEDGAQLARFDQALWTLGALDFVPHVFATDALAEQTPVLLVNNDADLPHHDVMVNIGSIQPPHFARYLRVVEVVGNNETERDQARSRWRFYKERGYALSSHDIKEARS
jgi:DNA polymerase-3 subunit chi